MEIESDPSDGFSFDASSTMYPSRLRVISSPHARIESPSGTIYGIVLQGSRRIRSGSFSAELPQGGFFSCVSSVDLDGHGTTVVFERLGFMGVQSAGVCEAHGRLAYIDGCSTSILVMPPRCGDSVLNLLHVPPGVLQSEHFHPSIRFGVVLSGQGVAFGASHHGTEKWEMALSPGAVFYLPAMERHAFQTVGQKEPLNIISYHPESDWGPTDESHPMLTRTLLMRRKPR
jgi:hypothetical protein